MRTLFTDLNIRIRIENAELLVLNIAFERFSRSIQKHSHGYGSYELHYIPFGQGTVIVDNDIHKITPNTLYVTGPYVEHEQIPDPTNPMAEYCLYFKLIKAEKDSYKELLKILEATPFWFGQDSEDINSCILMIFKELRNTHTGYMTQVESLLKQCIVKLIRNYERNKTARNRFAPSSLADRKYIITEEYFLYEYQTLSLETLAAKLGLGTRQTNRFLKDYYGKNFQQKKAEAKMSAASVLLNDENLSVTAIAMELGYSSLEHFATAFKRYYGMSAREYKRKNLGK